MLLQKILLFLSLLALAVIAANSIFRNASIPDIGKVGIVVILLLGVFSIFIFIFRSKSKIDRLKNKRGYEDPDTQQLE